MVALGFEFEADIRYWRGPSPYHFVTVPEPHARDIKAISAAVTYGWGVIRATVRIGNTEFTTSLFPKDGGYAVPIKDRVRKAEGLEAGDSVTLWLEISERAASGTSPASGRVPEPSRRSRSRPVP